MDIVDYIGKVEVGVTKYVLKCAIFFSALDKLIILSLSMKKREKRKSA